MVDKGFIIRDELVVVGGCFVLLYFFLGKR